MRRRLTALLRGRRRGGEHPRIGHLGLKLTSIGRRCSLRSRGDPGSVAHALSPEEERWNDALRCC